VTRSPRQRNWKFESTPSTKAEGIEGRSAPFFGSAWLMPVIQAAVVASRSKDPTGCWGPTFLSKLDMDAPVVGFTVLDII
jgi:hypothetical protein